MKTLAIKDICNKDSSALKQKELLSEGKYPVYGASGIAGYLDSYHQENEYIGIVKDGSGIGRVVFYPEKTSLIGTMQYILPKNGYNIRYIGYCLQSLDLSKYKQGAAIPHIYFRDYGERLVKVTEDEQEQRTIVARLDSAFAQIDALKANAEKQLSEARQLFQKALEEAMTPKEGWEEKTFGEVIKLQSGDNLSAKKIETGIYPVYGGNGIAGFHNCFNKEGKNIIVGRVGALCGNIHYVETPFWLTDNGFEVIVNKEFDLEMKFLSYYLTFLDLGKYARQTAQPVISNSSLKDIPIFIPPLSEQHSIVARLDSLSAKVRELEAIDKEVITECDNMKQAMLREVFE